MRQADQIMSEMFKIQRSASDCNLSLNTVCKHCAAVHRPKILAAIAANDPIPFVLPAFPGKSPNQEKVLGALPDKAEILALHSLQAFCERIKKVYEPGASIHLCSDGRVFSDVVGMTEENVSRYQDEIGTIIQSHGLMNLSTSHLDDFFQGLDFPQMRKQLLDKFGRELEEVQQKVRKGAEAGASNEEKEALLIFCGMTRFMLEDSIYSGQTKSKTALQKDAKDKAYKVIQRSNAWSELIESRFPEAIRLSIHPQSCSSKKFGIRFLGNENWITPWHGVAVKLGSGYQLMKRREAESKGFRLCYENGRPSHFVEMRAVQELRHEA